MNARFYMAIIGMVCILFMVDIATSQSSSNEVTPGQSKKSRPGMSLIPAGCFMMGNSSTTKKPGDDQPAHKVCITKDFFIDENEVTNSKYEACVKAGKCSEPHKKEGYSRPAYYDNPEYKDFPVVWVDWNQAKAYCEWSGGKLPAEAEWEYAARGGLDGKKYPWGDTLDGTGANYWDSGDKWDNATSPVGHYPPNGYGLHDMAGNVGEWTADWYDAGYYRNSPASDPNGPDNGEEKVVRGGDFVGYPNELTVFFRSPRPPATHGASIGFRCCAD